MNSDDMDDQNTEHNRDNDRESMTSNSQTKVSEKPKRKKKSKGLFSWFFWIVFAVVFFSAFNIIQEGFVGISQRFGKMQAVLTPGFHAKIPFIDSVELLETRIRIVELESQATNADHIEVKLKLTANWHLPASSAAIFYKKQGNAKQYEERVLIPLLRSVSHGLISQYTTSELLDKRSVINELMSTAIFNSSQLTPGILDSVQIEKFSLPESYQKGLEKKLTEEQVLEAEQLKANKGKIKAQADSDIAEIKANDLIKQAEATAQAMLIKGEAKATVIKQIVSAIKENRQYVQYEKIQKWDGRLSSNKSNLNEVFKSVEK